MFYITKDRYRAMDIRDHTDPGLPIWTKEGHFAVEISSREYLDPDAKTVDKLPEGWEALQ